MNKKTLFLSPNTLKKAIVESQILPLAAACKNETILLSKYEFDKLSKFEQSKIKTCKSKGLGSKIRILNKIKADYIYIRDPFDFILCFILRLLGFINCEFVYDFRGVAHEEMLFKNSKAWKCLIVKYLERFAYRKANFISCVSNNMKLSLMKKYGERNNVSMTPCGADFRIKKIIKCNEIVNFCYLGGLSEWQKFESVCNTIDHFKHIDKINFHIITKDIELAKYQLKQKGLLSENISVISLARSELPSYLSDMDYGFVFRDNTFINNTASPIKVSEYICAGIIPVLTSGVGDFYDILKNSGLGLDRAEFHNMDLQELKAMKNDDTIARGLYNLSEFYSWDKLASTHIVNQIGFN